MRFSYVVNDRRAMGPKTYQDLLDESLSGLLQWVQPSQVHVHCIPPHNPEYMEGLENRGIHVHIHGGRPLQHPFSFKLYLLDHQARDMAFIDADTWIWKNPEELLRWDYLVATRPERLTWRKKTNLIDHQVWADLLEGSGLRWTPLLSTGFVIVRGGIAKKLQRTWRAYYQILIDMGEEKRPVQFRYLDMASFSMAVAELIEPTKVWYLTPMEFGLERFDGKNRHCYVMDRRRLK